jgi:hypothetical protein
MPFDFLKIGNCWSRPAKSASLAHLALNPYITTMGLDYPSSNGKSQSGPPHLSASGFIHSVEAVKNMR